MPALPYPLCGCFTPKRHGPAWSNQVREGFSRQELRRVQEQAGCPRCRVKRYTPEATRCSRCELMRAYLACPHRQAQQLSLF